MTILISAVLKRTLALSVVAALFAMILLAGLAEWGANAASGDTSPANPPPAAKLQNSVAPGGDAGFVGGAK